MSQRRHDPHLTRMFFRNFFLAAAIGLGLLISLPELVRQYAEHGLWGTVWRFIVWGTLIGLTLDLGLFLLHVLTCNSKRRVDAAVTEAIGPDDELEQIIGVADFYGSDTLDSADMAKLMEYAGVCSQRVRLAAREHGVGSPEAAAAQEEYARVMRAYARHSKDVDLPATLSAEQVEQPA